MKKEKGITLIALAITIIALLIVGGIAISLVINNSDIITKTNNASKENQRMSAKEDIQMALTYAATECFINTKEITNSDQYSEFYCLKVSEYLNKTGKLISVESIANKQLEIKYEKYGNEYTFTVDENRIAVFKKEEKVLGKENGYLTLDENSGTVSHGTSSYTFTINTNHGGALSVTDDNSTAESEINGTTVIISNLDTIDIGTVIIITVNCESTKKYKEATATYTLTIDKATLSTPQVTINTDGLVQWDNVTGATEYEISFNNGTTWTSATSGTSSIDLTSNGEKNVKVRAKTTNTAEYNTPSNIGSATTTVYSLTLNTSSGITGVTGAGKYVAGKTVTINASVDGEYTWNRWNVTSGTTPASATSANTTVTIDNDTVLQATANQKSPIYLRTSKKRNVGLYNNAACSGTAVNWKKMSAGSSAYAVHISGNIYRLKEAGNYYNKYFKGW